ncbi:MAG: tetratricopeptide repeat protein [Deltaproteobacteria bacterium]|nr:tetratricopeptide repeat protein [Deltaproteobacteria bacterium]
MKIVTSDKSAYDTDIKPVNDVGATEKEDKDIKEISVATQDEYKKTPESNQDPDEAPTLNESSDFINQEDHDYPDVDDSIEKPAKQTDLRAFIDTKKDTIEETDNEKTNRPRDPLISEEDEEAPESETSLKTQDLKHIEPDDSDDPAAASRVDDIVTKSELEESTAKVDDESYSADDPVSKYMLLGREALKKEDFDNAIKYFLKVVDILPTSGAVLLNLADLYFLKKDYETARKYAVLALELGEKSAASVLEKINVVLAPDLTLQPLESNGEAIPPEPDDYADYAKPRAKKADNEPEQDKADDLENTVFIELNALNEALSSKENETPSPKKDDEKTVQKKDEARRYMAFGVEAAKYKHYHEAIEHFSKSVELFPNNSAGFCNLAVLNYRLKEYETAQSYAERAIDLGSPSANQILKKIKAVMTDNKKSSQDIQKKKSKNFFIESDDDTFAKFIKKENQSDLAVDTSLRETDAVVNDHFKRGLAAFEKKNFHKAIGHFNKVVKLLPNGVPSYIHLTKIHYHLGEYSQARQHAKKALELGDHTLKPIIDKIDARLAKESMELKEQETTVKAIEDTVTKSEVIEPQADIEPDKKVEQDESKPQTMMERPDVMFIESAASTEAADSRQNTAPVSMEKDVAKDINKKKNQNNDVKKFMALGVEAAGKKEHLKAVEHFRKVIEILPDSAVGFFNLAILYYHLGNYNMAGKHAEKALNLGLRSAQSILEKSKSKMVTDSKAPPAKNKEKPPAKKTLIQTDENKPDHINEAQMALPFEEPKETIAHSNTVLKQTEDLTKPVANEQPAAGDKLASETVPQVESLQIESPQVPSESDSASEYFKLGMAASERNDFNTALEYFNKVAMLLPQVPSSFLNMADLHCRMKNFKTARKYAQRALELGAHSAHRILDKIEDSLEMQTV